MSISYYQQISCLASLYIGRTLKTRKTLTVTADKYLIILAEVLYIRRTLVRLTVDFDKARRNGRWLFRELTLRQTQRTMTYDTIR